MKKFNYLWSFILLLVAVGVISFAVKGCGDGGQGDVTLVSDAADRVYVKPGSYDEFYAVVSGGFSGQMSFYGLPSGRLFKVISVFSQNPETGYGYTEETKAMLNTSFGFQPWDDSHHSELSQTDGVPDGRWVFINGNNTPRIARIDLKSFETVEIIEIPNSGGNHSSPFITNNTEYAIAGTRFSVPLGDQDPPIADYSKEFKGTLSFVKIDPQTGRMGIDFQIVTPPFNYDLSHSGKGPSQDWFFFSCYNSELAHTLLEINASQKDKDFILAINWKKAMQVKQEGKTKPMSVKYAHNTYDESTQSASTEMMESVDMMYPEDLAGSMFYIPCPKSPHGVDIDPTGEYFVGGGKLSTIIPVFSFSKMMTAIENKDYEGDVEGIPILKYESVLAGEVKDPGLGPLHTEFDNEGNAYTSMFVSSEVTKWKVSTQEVIDKIPVYYSIGHLMVPGGDSKQPWGKYLVALNKITKDRYLPTGPELTQSAQLIDITGDKMKLLSDFPTVGEPHYAQGIPADILTKNQIKIFKIEENNNPYATKSEKDARVVREGNVVHVYMTAIRSHLTPDNIEGVNVGDEVYFHVTNLEQDWDVPHGFTIKGSNTAEMLIMPGQTRTIKWVPDAQGIYPFYCTDFCSALHQEMSGYLRVTPKGSDVPLSFKTGSGQEQK
ncbi:MAG: Sec-dependent nitrous-oxide reductase [Ignavibacteriae bacterium]|nr:Sec-dependent nitrous-oxide reductase [Ignavibacteriota bacterium]MCB9242742.1 Sec-dependent nitrous-oxide reductase [Ignavibacteriales bacterium]